MKAIRTKCHGPTDKPWFDNYGHFIGHIPEEAIKDCSHPGECCHDCEAWVEDLGFTVPREQAIDYLLELGAWKSEELQAKDNKELAILVLWIACGEIQENGEWIGLIH